MSYRVTCRESCHRNIGHYNEKVKYKGRDGVGINSVNHDQKCLLHLYFSTRQRCFGANNKFVLEIENVEEPKPKGAKTSLHFLYGIGEDHQWTYSDRDCVTEEKTLWRWDVTELTRRKITVKLFLQVLEEKLVFKHQPLRQSAGQWDQPTPDQGCVKLVHVIVHKMTGNISNHNGPCQVCLSPWSSHWDLWDGGGISYLHWNRKLLFPLFQVSRSLSCLPVTLHCDTDFDTR